MTLTHLSLLAWKKGLCVSAATYVYPMNAMGISKAMMEKVVIAQSRAIGRAKTAICITQHGNVMHAWMRGSVIPLFVQLTESDPPRTVTDPNMNRFLMSLTECQEVMYSAA